MFHNCRNPDLHTYALSILVIVYLNILVDSQLLVAFLFCNLNLVLSNELIKVKLPP